MDRIAQQRNLFSSDSAALCEPPKPKRARLAHCVMVRINGAYHGTYRNIGTAFNALKISAPNTRFRVARFELRNHWRARLVSEEGVTYEFWMVDTD